MPGQVLDLVGAILLLCGAFLALTAAIGLLRLPDVLNRMHAATKPQTLGLICVTVGLACSLRQPAVLGMLLLVGLFQLLSAPVAAHMVARGTYRTHQVREDTLVVDELSEDLSRAGFAVAADPTESGAGTEPGDGDSETGPPDAGEPRPADRPPT